MLLKKSFFAVILFVALFIIGQQSVFACSCSATPTVLDSFENSELVVVTKLVLVEKVVEGEDEYAIDGIKSVKMVVEKVYKGNVKVGDELTFAQGNGGDCIWTFDEKSVGEKFLFYLDLPSKGHPMFGEEKDATPMYYAVTCGRSNGFESAENDFSYLNNIDKLRGKTRISGYISGNWGKDSSNLSIIQLTIKGKNKTYTAKTNKNGFFEIYDLPAGDYIVEPGIPIGWKLDVDMFNYLNEDNPYSNMQESLKENQFFVHLEKGRHANLDLLYVIDNAIQ